ncbi:hypothetical protein IAT38_000613 [Cryptococcus sp. DSM 104549]
MADLSVEEKCKLAAKLIEQTPPGEINDVINDIRAIVADDNALMPHVLPALRAYNLTQLHVVEHSEAEGIPSHSSLLSEAAVLPGSAEVERYVDAAGKRSFVFDHAGLVASDYQPYELPEEEEAFRAELATSLAAYTKNHFPSGFSTVSSSQFPLLPPAPAQTAPAVGVTPAESSDAAPKESESKPTDTAEATETTEETPALTAAIDIPERPVTDLVPEQVGTGDLEPSPTPAVDGGLEAKKEEVEEPGGLEKLDEAVEEEKEREEKEESGEEAVVSDAPKVEEEGAEKAGEAGEDVKEEVPVAADTDAEKPEEKAVEQGIAGLAVDDRKQERVENPIYTLEVVGNRYNPSNFWTGRWRTRWVVDQEAGKVKGTINVDVHYYEQGNVQLATQHKSSFPYPTAPAGNQSIASQIVTTISKIETEYHLELNDVYGELGDKAFRALRRALPVTRQKMDWEKVSGYTLGADLNKARA